MAFSDMLQKLSEVFGFEFKAIHFVGMLIFIIIIVATLIFIGFLVYKKYKLKERFKSVVQQKMDSDKRPPLLGDEVKKYLDDIVDKRVVEAFEKYKATNFIPVKEEEVFVKKEELFQKQSKQPKTQPSIGSQEPKDIDTTNEFLIDSEISHDNKEFDI